MLQPLLLVAIGTLGSELGSGHLDVDGAAVLEGAGAVPQVGVLGAAQEAPHDGVDGAGPHEVGGVAGTGPVCAIGVEGAGPDGVLGWAAPVNRPAACPMKDAKAWAAAVALEATPVAPVPLGVPQCAHGLGEAGAAAEAGAVALVPLCLILHATASACVAGIQKQVP